MKKQTRIVISILATLLFAVGCSDPTTPTKEHFKQALDRLYQNDNPAKIRLGSEIPTTVADTHRADQEKLDALVAAGLLSRENTTTADTDQTLSPFESKRKQIPAKKYTLTDLGKRAYFVEGSFPMKSGAFRYGVYRVRDVTSFTKHDSVPGRAPVFEVHFTYAAEQIADWAQNPALRAKFPDLDGVHEDMKPLIAGNDGWHRL